MNETLAPAAAGMTADMILPAALLLLTYGAIITERFNRAVVALLGGGLTIVLGVLDQERAIEAIDFNTLGLLTGMMIIVGVSRKSGLFGYVAVRAAQIVRGSPQGTMVALAIVTAVFSAFLDNVTTVLLIVPVTFLICAELDVPVYPYLVTEILASNIGGTATLIGDPPNILIGSAVGLTFNDFVINLAPVVAVILAMQLGINHLVWGRKMRATAERRERVMGLKAAEAITDRHLLFSALAVISAVMLAFVFHGMLHLEAATIALLGAAALMFLDTLPRSREEQTEAVTHAFHEVEWITIFFFVGLFVVIGGVEHAGILALLAQELLELTGGDPEITAIGILWSSAVLSAIVDNIPFVATMIPLIKSLAPAMGGEAAIMPLWWALSLGACLGGNGTLIGASANLTVAGLAERNGVPFRFITFSLAAFPMMLASIAIAHLYLAWFYF